MSGMVVERVPRRRAETRARLLLAARELFGERGVAGVTVEAICERAGYTRGAFYSNFGSIEALLLAIYVDHAEGLLTELRAAVETTLVGAAGPISTEDAVEAIVELLPYDPESFGIRMSFASHARPDPATRTLLSDSMAALREQLGPVLIDAVRRAGREVLTDQDTFTRAVVAAHDGALAAGLVDADARALRTVVIRAVIDGLTRESSVL